MAENAEAEDIDEGVARVGIIEIDFAADGGDADAVAVVADSRDDSGEEAAVRAGGGGIALDGAEAQGVHRERRTGSHREDVANDAADAGGRALEGFDGAGVVVAFDFEGDGPTVSDVDDARVFFTGFDENAFAGGGEFAEFGF